MADCASPLRIFVGASEATRLEFLVLAHTLRTHSRHRLDIAMLNGSRGVLERDGGEIPLPFWPLLRRQVSATEFSYLRWLVPALAGQQGRALYLDSDMLCLADIASLFESPLHGAQFLALPSEFGRPERPLWRTSVMPVDCDATRFDLPRIFAEAEQGHYQASDFLQLAPAFLARHPYRIGRLDPAWNRLDGWDGDTRLVHYTDLARQPWRHPGHPQGRLWFDWLRRALAAGAVQASDLRAARAAGALGAGLLRSYGEPEPDALNP